MDLEPLYRRTQECWNSVEDTDAEWRCVAEAYPDELRELIRNVPIDDDCALGAIYAALGWDLPRNRELLLEEMDRLLELMERTPRSLALHQQMEGFAFMDTEDDEAFRLTAVEIGAKRLSSETPQIRRAAVSFLGVFVEQRDWEVVREVRRMQVEDGDWRVRKHCYIVLENLAEDGGGFAGPEPPRWTDWLREGLGLGDPLDLIA